MAACRARARLQDHWSGGWVELYPEGYQQAHQRPPGQARAGVQLRGLYDVVHKLTRSSSRTSTESPLRSKSRPRWSVRLGCPTGGK